MEAVRFDDQVVVVTGAGRGLGRAYALELGRRGASVVVNDVAAAFADEVASAIVEAGGTAVASHDSVADPAGGEALIQRAVDAFGTVDGLVNNAGILRNGLFEDLTVEQLDAVVGVNLRGAFFATQPAWRIMKTKGHGRVVLTSSAAGLFSRAGSVNYSATKAAMYGMCRALSFEGADHGIAVNVVLPRATSTITAADPIPGAASYYSPELGAALAPRRNAEATAGLVCYLVSRDCAVNGEAFSSAFGCYSRVFVGRTEGWLADEPDAVGAEDIAAHLDRIEDREGYAVPASNHHEVELVAARLGIPATAG